MATTSSSSVNTTPYSDDMFATLVEMGFSVEIIAKAIQENRPNADASVIIDTISKYTSNSEAGSSKCKVIDHFLGMGFDEENIIKAIHEHGDENMEQIANALLSSIKEAEEEDEIVWTSSVDEKDPNCGLW